MEAELLDLMPHTIYRSTKGTMDRYGSPQWGTPVAYRARVVMRQREIRQANNQSVTSQATAWVDSTGVWSVDDRITLPAGALPTTSPSILLVESFPDENGNHHIKIGMGF